MRKAAYISLLVYIPALIAFMMFTGDSKLLDFLWFAMDKIMMCVLLLALRSTEFNKNRKALYGAFSASLMIYILYLLLDYQGIYRGNIIIVSILSLTYISAIIYTIIYHGYDRKSS